jgi:hypothetical protein
MKAAAHSPGASTLASKMPGSGLPDAIVVVMPASSSRTFEVPRVFHHGLSQ